jgi:hypothetical protein
MKQRNNNVFDKIEGYGFVHHRALNSPQALNYTMGLISKHPTRSHILEGDICWDETEGEVNLYFRHPSWIIDTPSTATIRRHFQSGQLVGLDDLYKLKDTPATLIVELKVGREDWRVCLSKLINFLEENFPGRYWIDGFSLPMLEFVKHTNSDTMVTLHTEFVYNRCVFVGAPEWPPVKFRKLDDLKFVDGIAIRWRFGEGYMSKACKDVHDAGKYLIISRLHDLKQFECSKKWNAVAGYMHWDFEALLAANDLIESREP